MGSVVAGYGLPGSVAPQHVESSWPRDQTFVPCIGRRTLNHWTTWEVPWSLIYCVTLSPHTLPSQLNGGYLEVPRLRQEGITLTQFFCHSLWVFGSLSLINFFNLISYCLRLRSRQFLQPFKHTNFWILSSFIYACKPTYLWLSVFFLQYYFNCILLSLLFY